MRWTKILLVGGLMITAFGQLTAQYFGRNKPHYEKFDFEVYQTPHFEIYHYLENEEVLNRISTFTEQWYQLHQNILRDTFTAKNPVIFYNDHADFQQTNAIRGGIGVGTGGVTEAFKNRVIMPFAMSNQQTFHVLGHELVHAFQYHMVIQGDSTSLQNIANLPLWMVEGLAEYMSIGGVDAHTAMWMRSAVLNDDIPTLKDLNNPGKYFPYRYGQVFWAFLTGLSGDDVIEPFYTATAKHGIEAASRQVLGISLNSLSNLWQEALKKHYSQYVEVGEKEAFIGRELLAEEKKKGRINIAPVISPNGRYAIFLSERNLFSIDLFLADVVKKEIIREVASSAKNAHIDNFDYIESAGTWSPDSKRFAFVGYSRGRQLLIIKDALSGKTIEEVKIDGVPAFTNPTWSPDGNYIAFAGLRQGQVDLYAYNLKTGKVTQLTDDVYSEMHPHYSADGRSLLFSTDQRSFQRGRTNGKWTFNLARLDLGTGEVEQYDVFPGADNLNPLEDANGDIIFLSNRDGFRNIYRYSPYSGKVYQMTDLLTGVSGITHYAPAISISRDRGRILYTYFNNNQYKIFRGNRDEFLNTEVDPDSVDFTAATLPRVNDRAPMIVDAQLNNLEESEAEASTLASSFREKDYKAQFQLDYIGGGAGVGLTNNNFIAGGNNRLAGSIDALFSDILGNHNIFASAAVNGEVLDFGANVLYLNKTNTLNWGVFASHIPNRFISGGFLSDGSGNIVTQNIEIDGQEFPTNYVIDNFRLFVDEVGLMSQYIFSQSLRLEGSASFSRYYTRLDRDFYFNDGLGLRFWGREQLETAPGFSLWRAGTALVGDNSYFGLTSPLRGYRFRIGIDRFAGEFSFTAPTIDVRYYKQLRPVTFAFRAYHYGRYGGNSESLSPLFVGSPWLVRGFNTNATQQFTQNGLIGGGQALPGSNFGGSIPNDEEILFSLLGSKMFVANFEVRLPFTGPRELALIPVGFFFSDLNLFFDSGVAWFDFNQLSDSSNRFPSASPVFSAGASLRVNLFGSLIVEPYYAIPLLEGAEPGFGLNLIQGW